MYDLTQAPVEFIVKAADGTEHKVMHVFRPNTCPEELAQLKAEAEEGKLPDLEMYLARTERKRQWWDDHVIEVEGYQFPEGLNGLAWKNCIPPNHKYQGYWFFFSARESYARPNRDSGTNSNGTAAAENMMADAQAAMDASSSRPTETRPVEPKPADVLSGAQGPGPSTPAGSDTSSESKT